MLSDKAPQKLALQKLLRQGALWVAENQSTASQPSELQEIFCAGSVHELLYPEHPPIILITHLAKELCGSKTEERLIFWIGRSVWPTPFAINEPQIYRRCFFLDPPSSRLIFWSIENMLRSLAAPLVVAACSQLSFVSTRRLALAAKQSGALGFLLRPDKFSSAASAVKSRWLITPLKSNSARIAFKLLLLKHKGKQAPCNEWRIEFEEDGRLYETLPLHISYKPPSKTKLRA